MIPWALLEVILAKNRKIRVSMALYALSATATLLVDFSFKLIDVYSSRAFAMLVKRQIECILHINMAKNTCESDQ